MDKGDFGEMTFSLLEEYRKSSEYQKTRDMLIWNVPNWAEYLYAKMKGKRGNVNKAEALFLAAFLFEKTERIKIWLNYLKEYGNVEFQFNASESLENLQKIICPSVLTESEEENVKNGMEYRTNLTKNDVRQFRKDLSVGTDIIERYLKDCELANSHSTIRGLDNLENCESSFYRPHFPYMYSCFDDIANKAVKLSDYITNHYDFKMAATLSKINRGVWGLIYVKYDWKADDRKRAVFSQFPKVERVLNDICDWYLEEACKIPYEDIKKYYVDCNTGEVKNRKTKEVFKPLLGDVQTTDVQSINPEPQQSKTTRRKGRPKYTFKDYMVNDEDGRKLEKIRSVMNGRKGKKAALVIWTCMKIGWIVPTPTFKAVADEFGNIGTQQGFTGYLNDMSFTDAEKESMENIFKKS
ncbi:MULTISPECIES: hypothetical protein [unclassified Bacteroides]|uniref:hypothetical protein n=1 Tax=unclassified Bacteroides TaxID=2646097 RepID=UPI000AE7096C|nr:MULTISPECIES: hypothetical protein [unclassified Bacteroides]